jgi:hypothetical protein
MEEWQPQWEALGSPELLGMAFWFTVMSCSPPEESMEINDGPCGALEETGNDAAAALELSPLAIESLNGMTREMREGHLPAA